MVFSSLTFLLAFLPAVLLVYYLVPRPARNYVLLVFSLIFYAWGEPVYVFLMLGSIAGNYLLALWIGHSRQKGKEKSAKLGIILTVVFNIGLLGFFKYADFILGTAGTILGQAVPKLGLALPIGISFYTFQTMSYVIDVYRGEVRVQRNPFLLGTYVTLFPQLIAGPIVRYSTVEEELAIRRESWNDFGDGISRFVVGLGKKVLLANSVGQVFAQISGLAADELSTATAWLGVVAYTLQIYFDFSGYSDMAIGLGKMFGFTFLENFDYPYISRSITEFWRRWHISLSTWFRDYVYIPLGGNRKGKGKQYRNIFIVWMLTGLWHGAGWNFVLWGLYYAVLLIVEKAFLGKWLDRLPRALQHVYALLLVMIGWVIFSVEDIGQLGIWLRTLFGFGTARADARAGFYAANYGGVLLLGILCCLPWKNWQRAAWLEKTRCVWEPAGMLLILGVSFVFLISSSYNPFLYFRF